MSYQTDVLSDGPVGYWTVDETSGTTVTDSSGNGRNGTYIGSPTLNQTSLLPIGGGKCVRLGGSSYINIPHNSAFNLASTTDDLTIEFWVKLDNPSAATLQILVDKTNITSSRGQYVLWWDNRNVGAGTVNNLRFRYNDGSTLLEWTGSNPNAALATGGYLAVVVGTSTVLMYWNGNLVALGTKGAGSVSTFNTDPVTFGGRSDGTGFFMTGYLDEIAIHPVALAPSRLKNRYESVRPPTALARSAPDIWHKADAIVGLADGASVSSWVGSDALANAATQATGTAQPTYKTNIQNGLPVVRFGGDDYLSSPISASTTSHSVAVVLRATAIGYQTILGAFGGTNGNSGFSFGLSDGVSARLLSQNIAEIARSSVVAVEPGQFQVVIATLTSGGAWAFYVDGVAAGSGTTSSTIGGTTTTEIGRSLPGNFLTGDVGELAKWNNKILTPTEIADITAELQLKWATLRRPITDITWSASTAFTNWDAAFLGDGSVGVASVPTRSWSASAPAPATVQGLISVARVANAYRVWARPDAAASAPSAWTLEGSNNGGSSWTPLDTRSGITWVNGEAKTFSISNTTPYLLYRMSISATQGGGGTWPSFSELTLYEPITASKLDAVNASALVSGTPERRLDAASVAVLARGGTTQQAILDAVMLSVLTPASLVTDNFHAFWGIRIADYR